MMGTKIEINTVSWNGIVKVVLNWINNNVEAHTKKFNNKLVEPIKDIGCSTDVIFSMDLFLDIPLIIVNKNPGLVILAIAINKNEDPTNHVK